jgi:hypothetical protein
MVEKKYGLWHFAIFFDPLICNSPQLVTIKLDWCSYILVGQSSFQHETHDQVNTGRVLQVNFEESTSDSIRE